MLVQPTDEEPGYTFPEYKYHAHNMNQPPTATPYMFAPNNTTNQVAFQEDFVTSTFDFSGVTYVGECSEFRREESIIIASHLNESKSILIQFYILLTSFLFGQEIGESKS